MQLYYEDIIEGSNMPDKLWGPLTNMDMIRFGSALDSYGEIHQDYDWCIEHGFDNVLLSGPFKQALLCSWFDEVVGDMKRGAHCYFCGTKLIRLDGDALGCCYECDKSPPVTHWRWNEDTEFLQLYVDLIKFV